MISEEKTDRVIVILVETPNQMNNLNILLRILHRPQEFQVATVSIQSEFFSWA
jgi:hypothetical protein